MSSLQIAEITGKRHDGVLRDIREILEQAGIEAHKFVGYYIATNGKQNPCYHLPRRECDLDAMHTHCFPSSPVVQHRSALSIPRPRTPARHITRDLKAILDTPARRSTGGKC